MPGLGTIVNVIAVVIAGVIGTLLGERVPKRMQGALVTACGVSVIFIGAAGAFSGMLEVQGASMVAGKSLLVVISILGGTVIGEAIDIDGLIERFGSWLKAKTGSSKDPRFTDAFVTASITICVGAMAIVGAIEDGIAHDHSILFTKALIDFVFILALSSSLGRGCAFSAIPVGIWQGVVTALAVVIAPLMTEAALANLSLVGSILIFCVGVNLVFGQKIRVANMLPAVVVAPLLSLLPFAL